MKLIIAGKRDIYPSITMLHTLIGYHLKDIRQVTEIVSGGASGVDTGAKNICNNKIGSSSYDLYLFNKYKEFPADWDKHGKAAGPIRNAEMAKYGDALLLIWDGESKGSANMKENMLKLNKPVYEVILKSYNVEDEDEL